MSVYPGSLCVLLIVGGDSSERDVSLDTGKNVYDALHTLGHRVLVADPYRPKLKASQDTAPFFGDVKIGDKPPVIGGERYRIRTSFMNVLSQFDGLHCDVVFNALHGGSGEDGTFQAVLEYLGIRFTGSGSIACALAMDKELCKRLAVRADVPVAKHVFVDSVDRPTTLVEEEVLDTLRLPAVVKPNHEGSSVGVRIVTSRSELGEAIENAATYGAKYLVEEYIAGREVTAAILDQEELPLLEIRPKKGFYDYRNKYQPGSCDYLVPAPLDRKTSDEIARSAREVYRALDCRGYARVDFRLSDTGRHYLLEVNTLPGLTATSLVPKAAKAVGIEYTKLVSRILDLAMSV